MYRYYQEDVVILGKLKGNVFEPHNKRHKYTFKVIEWNESDCERQLKKWMKR